MIREFRVKNSTGVLRIKQELTRIREALLKHMLRIIKVATCQAR